MSLQIGQQLGSYEITSLLGKGGMGEVYRARDSKLKRDVAIKILPDEFARDPDRSGRFQREAEVVASLNHPNIGAIYDIQEHAGSRFLILELVEGETLAERIRRGPVPIEDALDIAKQICEALEAAHEKGIVHRDLKPANVKVQPDGKVKVLDFGLAKALENRPANAVMSQSPTLSLAATQAGVIIGTAAYMSPEQARGLEADHRSDVFAFGCILYELLTARQGFQGDTISDVLASILKVDPDLNLLPPRLNPRIRDLLRRCLEKNPKRRWQAIGDLRAEIESVSADPRGVLVSEAYAVSRPLWKRATPVAVAMIFGAVVTGVAMWSLRPASPAEVVTRFAVALGEGQQFTGSGRNLVAISADGSQIVYVANNRLYLRPIGELEAKVIPGSESLLGLQNPVFSPDGGSIAFFSNDDTALKRIAVTGGTPTLLGRATPPYGMDWSEYGIVFGQGSGGIMRVSENGGEPEPLVTVKSDELASAPQMLPGGKAVLFSLATGAAPDRWDRATVAVQTIGSPERKVLIEGGFAAHYVSTRHIVYAYLGTLRAVPFDLSRLEKTGGSVSVVEGVRQSVGITHAGASHLSFSSNGSLAYVPGPVGQSARDLALIDREGHAKPLTLQPGTYSAPRVSPNGKQVAFQTDDGANSMISIYDLSGGTSPRRLTFGGNNRYPVWSSDSKWLAFQSDREGDLAIFQQRADGAGPAQRLTKPDADTSHVPNSWSSDQNLLFELRKGSAGSLWVWSPSAEKVTPFGDIENSNPIDAVFSPDGRWVAYNSRETGRNEVFVQPFPATLAKYQIPNSADNHASVWSPDGKELLYVAGPGQFAAVRIGIEPSFAVGNTVSAFNGNSRGTNAPNILRNFDIMPDGKHIVVIVDAGQDQTSAASGPQIQVILNWFSELQQRVPVK